MSVAIPRRKVVASPLALETDLRVVKLEGNYENLSDSVVDVKGEVQGLANRFEQFSNDIHTTLNRIGRPQWGVITAFVGLIFTVMVSAGGAGFTILRMSADHENELRVVASTFQDKVVDARFKQIETQFLATANETQVEISHNSEINVKQNDEIKRLSSQLYEVDERLLDKNTQWREDFDKYIWPSLKHKLYDGQ